MSDRDQILSSSPKDSSGEASYEFTLYHFYHKHMWFLDSFETETNLINS